MGQEAVGAHGNIPCCREGGESLATSPTAWGAFGVLGSVGADPLLQSEQPLKSYLYGWTELENALLLKVCCFWWNGELNGLGTGLLAQPVKASAESKHGMIEVHLCKLKLNHLLKKVQDLCNLCLWKNILRVFLMRKSRCGDSISGMWCLLSSLNGGYAVFTGQDVLRLFAFI